MGLLDLAFLALHFSVRGQVRRDGLRVQLIVLQAAHIFRGDPYELLVVRVQACIERLRVEVRQLGVLLDLAARDMVADACSITTARRFAGETMRLQMTVGTATASQGAALLPTMPVRSGIRTLQVRQAVVDASSTSVLSSTVSSAQRQRMARLLIGAVCWRR